MSIIDPQSAAAAIGLVNSAFSSVKTALDLAKKTTDLDLKQEISKAFDNVLELKATVYELAEENRNLRLSLELKENISYFPQTGFFFKEGEFTPLSEVLPEPRSRCRLSAQMERWLASLPCLRKELLLTTIRCVQCTLCAIPLFLARQPPSSSGEPGKHKESAA